MFTKRFQRFESPVTPIDAIDPILRSNLEILTTLRNRWLMTETPTIESRRNVMAINAVLINTERLLERLL